MFENTEQLRAFHELFVKGIITKEEFEEQKKRLLGVTSPTQKLCSPDQIVPKETIHENSSKQNWILFAIPLLTIGLMIIYGNHNKQIELKKASSYSENQSQEAYQKK